jgi:thiamine-monophosphate kinase
LHFFISTGSQFDRRGYCPEGYRKIMSNLKELGEFGFIDRIANKVAPGTGVAIGIGDDAAATLQKACSLTLTTTDMLIEGVHFDLSFCDPFTLGRKSLAVNLSDIAAMGGKPCYFLLSMAIPETLSVEFLDEFTNGILAMAGEFDVTLIGGDTCSSKAGFVISVTVIGEQHPDRVVTRSGARPGDLIFVSGTLGDSALGLALLRSGVKQGFAVTRHLDPTPRVREGLAMAAAKLPTSMLDVSDGLLSDLGHFGWSTIGPRLYTLVCHFSG